MDPVIEPPISARNRAPLIAVTGAAGKTGLAVVRALVARGAAVRAAVHRAGQVAAVKAAGAGEWSVGDLLDPDAAARAVAGVDGVFHICPNVHPDEEAMGRQVIAAAASASVRRFVFYSVLRPQIEAMPHHWRKMRVEERLWASGLAATVLQPAALMQNFEVHAAAAARGGPVELPYAATARFSLVDLRDVAEAAAHVTLESGHVGATYELSGPEALSGEDIAGLFQEALARAVELEITSPERWLEQARRAGPPRLDDRRLEALAAMFRYYDRHGFVGNPTVLAHLLGRPPRTLRAVMGSWDAFDQKKRR